MDRETWCAAVHWVAKSQTWLSNWTECQSLSRALHVCILSILSNLMLSESVGDIIPILTEEKPEACLKGLFKIMADMHQGRWLNPGSACRYKPCRLKTKLYWFSVLYFIFCKFWEGESCIEKIKSYEDLCVLSHVWLFATQGTVACLAPLSLSFPR